MGNSLYVNCWHINDYESAAMWKLYLKSDEGIAIQTTIGALKASLENETRKIRIGRITYINYESHCINMSKQYDFVLHKRLSFAHENEIRAVIWHYEPAFEEVVRQLNELEKNRRAGQTLEGVPVNVPNGAMPENTPSGLPVKIDAHQLIQTVYVAPSKDLWFADLVQSLVRRYGVGPK